MAQWQPVPKIRHQKFSNDPILLYRGSSKIIDGENIIEGISDIQLVWHPFPRITMKFTYSGQDEINLEDVELKLAESFISSNLKFHLYKSVYYENYRENGRKEISGYLIEDWRKGKTVDLSSLVFHIPNFWYFNTSNEDCYDEDEQGNEIEIQKEGWGIFLGQFIFEYDNWHIVLAALDDSFEMEEQLKEKGGYGITHVCKIKHLDNTEFSLDEANQVVEAFLYYLSFVRGIWLAPILLSGFDAEGYQILEEWSAAKIKTDSWQYGYKWADIDLTMGMDIIEKFPGFMKKWQDDIWKEVIQNAIQWYLESLDNLNGYNTSIVLVQAALEKLAWTYLKEKQYSTANFNQLKASQKVKRLLEFLSVEIITINDDYPYMKSNAYNDSVIGITAIRNDVIHPPSKDNNEVCLPSQETIKEAFDISHSYLLNCLLKLFEESS